MNLDGFAVSIHIDAIVPMPDGYASSDIERVITVALRDGGAAGSWEISIVFTDDDELRRLHGAYSNDDTPTDIMTFPLESDHEWFGGSPIVSGGDIAISVDRAREQSIDEGWDASRELLFLVAHGVLHLLGWNDGTPESREAMLDRQREILGRL